MIWHNTFGYKLLLLLHLISVVVGFGPYFLNGLLHRSAVKDGDGSRVVGAAAYQVSRASQFAIYGVVIFGGALVGASNKRVDFGDWWLPAAVVIWVAAVGVLHGMILPLQRKMRDGQGDAQQLSMAYGIMNVLVLVALVLMVWEPGSTLPKI